jgi:hypothetical protein
MPKIRRKRGPSAAALVFYIRYIFAAVAEPAGGDLAGNAAAGRIPAPHHNSSDASIHRPRTSTPAKPSATRGHHHFMPDVGWLAG